MLDDLKYIHERDGQDALGVAQNQWQQLQHDFQVKWEPTQAVSSVVLAGMGGSALAALVIQSWPRLTVPYEIVRQYSLPAYVGPGTVFIASSYSGNTEETLAALTEAESRQCQIVVLSSGGALVERAKEKNYPLYLLPGGLQPRMAVLYSLAALLELFSGLGVLAVPCGPQVLETTATWLQDKIKAWEVNIPTKTNLAKSTAQELVGKSVVVYGGPLLYPAAYKWKISFNESSKYIAWVNQLPEFNHNEMLGWTKQPVDKPYAVIDLRSNLENPRVQKRFEITEQVLSGMRPTPIVIQAEGETPLQQLLWTIALGDFVSLYLALLSNINPTPVELIEKFKKALN